MKDVICLDVAVCDFVEGKTKKLCNYKKMFQLSQILNQITSLAENKPPILPKQDLVRMLRVRKLNEVSNTPFSVRIFNRSDLIENTQKIISIISSILYLLTTNKK